MGREIRRVPPNWEHPKQSKYNPLTRQEEESYHPQFDEAYLYAFDEWLKEHVLWEKGEHPDQQDKDTQLPRYYAEWNGNPPDVDYYRPDWKPEEMTWWQVYETVSEGTPVTPPFETREELVEYLVANGDFWDQSRRKEGRSSMPCGPWSRQQAVAFVFGPGWAPSGIMTTDGVFKTGVQALGDQAGNNQPVRTKEAKTDAE